MIVGEKLVAFVKAWSDVSQWESKWGKLLSARDLPRCFTALWCVDDHPECQKCIVNTACDQFWMQRHSKAAKIGGRRLYSKAGSVIIAAAELLSISREFTLDNLMYRASKTYKRNGLILEDNISQVKKWVRNLLADLETGKYDGITLRSIETPFNHQKLFTGSIESVLVPVSKGASSAEEIHDE